MSNLTYWERRQVNRLFGYMQSAEDTADQIAKLYQTASGYISNQMDKIFRRFRRKHGLSETEARRLLAQLQDSTSLAELKALLGQSKDKEEIAELLAELEAPAYQARLERLQQTQNQLDQVMRNVYHQENLQNTSFYVDLANRAYYESIFQIQQRAGVAFDFSMIDPRVIDRVVGSRWSRANYSSRIWKNTEALAKSLKEELLVSLVTGRTDRETAEIIANKFAAGASKARRLVRTESAYLSSQMDMESYKECGLETYIFLATLDLRTSDICRSLDKKRFKISEQQPGVNCPPMHPWCRSTTISGISDEELAKLQQRGIDPEIGKAVKIPGNMTYQQWYDKYVKGKPAAELAEKKIKNRAADRKQFAQYKKILGADAPKTLDEFQEMKYNNSEEFENLKNQYRTQKKVLLFKEKLSKGTANLSVKKQKQQEHILGRKKWKERVRLDLKEKASAPDMFYKTVDVEQLVKEYSGTGVLQFRKGQDYPIEYISANYPVGKAFNLESGRYMDTKRFAIRYSSKGVHLHPVKEV